MNTTLNLTYEEGMKIVEAMRVAAIEMGWKSDEIDTSGVIQEYSHVVDSVFSALNIALNIDAAPLEEEEEEDEAFDLLSYLDEDEDESDMDDPIEAISDDDTFELTPKGHFVCDYMKLGHSFDEACRIANILFNEQEGE